MTDQEALRLCNEYHENGKKLPDVPGYARGLYVAAAIMVGLLAFGLWRAIIACIGG